MINVLKKGSSKMCPAIGLNNAELVMVNSGKFAQKLETSFLYAARDENICRGVFNLFFFVFVHEKRELATFF